MRHLLAMLLVVFWLAGPALADTLRVVTLYSPPIAFDLDGQPAGMGVDLVREGLARIGHQATISIVPWKRAIHMARYGEADAIFYLVRNKEREQWFHFPGEHLVMETTVMLKRAGENLDISLKRTDYRCVRIGLGLGYYYGQKLTSFLDRATFESVEKAPNIATNYSKLQERRIDVFLSDLTLARRFLKKCAPGGEVDIITDKAGNPLVFDSVKSFLAFSKATMSRETADAFSKALTAMKADGTYDRIANRYR